MYLFLDEINYLSINLSIYLDVWMSTSVYCIDVFVFITILQSQICTKVKILILVIFVGALIS